MIGFISKYIKVLSAWRSGLERRFYDDHDRKVKGSTPNLVCKMLHNDYLCLVEFSNQQIKEVRSIIQPENSETKVTSKRVWIGPKHSASVAFSWYRRIKTKKSKSIFMLELKKRSSFVTRLLIFPRSFNPTNPTTQN